MNGVAAKMVIVTPTHEANGKIPTLNCEGKADRHSHHNPPLPTQCHTIERVSPIPNFSLKSKELDLHI